MKTEINVSLVGRLIAAQFPQWTNRTITPVEIDGWANRSFRLGKDMLVRQPSAKAYAEQVIDAVLADHKHYVTG